jgi:hypothetical protein
MTQSEDNAPTSGWVSTLQLVKAIEMAKAGCLDYDTLSRSMNNMTTAELDAFIAWKAGSIAVLRSYKLDSATRGANMQRQFTIELRVDFADPDKLPALKQVLQQAARHAYATAQLISDNPKLTQVAIFSDDFFTGHEEIKLLEDTIASGLEADPDSSEDVKMAEIAASLST